MRWCARCGNETDDGILLCGSCLPRRRLRQDVLISLGSPVRSKVEAYEVVPGKSKRRSPLRVVEKVEYIYDRKRMERRVWLYDRQGRLYCETCFDLKTGKITWGPKSGDFYDQSIHSKNRNRRTDSRHDMP